MKDFALVNGDLSIYNNDVEMVNGDDLVRQKSEMLIGTNKGEWFLDKMQGIDFKVILGKNVRMETVKEEILQALKTIDDTFYIEKFDCSTIDRKLVVKFIAINETGEAVKAEYSFD